MLLLYNILYHIVDILTIITLTYTLIGYIYIHLHHCIILTYILNYHIIYIITNNIHIYLCL